jgi:hypothetical protein
VKKRSHHTLLLGAEERELPATVVVICGRPLDKARGGVRSTRGGHRGVDLRGPSQLSSEKEKSNCSSSMSASTKALSSEQSSTVKSSKRLEPEASSRIGGRTLGHTTLTLDGDMGGRKKMYWR